MLTFISRCDSSRAYRRERLTSVTARLVVHSRSATLLSAIMRAVREKGSIAPLSPTPKIRDWWCCTNIYPFIANLAFSLSLSYFSFFLSLFPFSLAHYCITLKPKRLSLLSSGPLYQMYMSLAILEFCVPQDMNGSRDRPAPTELLPDGNPEDDVRAPAPRNPIWKTRRWASSSTDYFKDGSATRLIM